MGEARFAGVESEKSGENRLQDWCLPRMREWKTGGIPLGAPVV